MASSGILEISEEKGLLNDGSGTNRQKENHGQQDAEY
jgi:hypothetical protein